MMKISLVLLLILLTNIAFSAQTATVKFVRGKATMLLPGSTEAIRVKKGMLIPEETSIVTANRSIVRIVFKDKTSMNIGPKSKVIISKLPPKKANLVSLLTGAIKATVAKTSGKTTKTKMLVKTRTAVMGVRGTKFQTTYNPINKATSLVTIEGKVAMVKLKEVAPVIESEVSNTTQPTAKVDNVDTLDKLIETSKDTVEVPAGRYSGVVAKVDKATLPVKIAPQQYNAIAKSMGSKKTAKEVMKITDHDPVPEGFSDKASGQLAPKAGGYIDFNTGIYVAPSKNAVLDKKTGTYKAKNIGTVNASTGAYIPPKGIKIDAKKGFIIDTTQSKELASSIADKKKLQKTIALLNEDVKKQIVVNKTQSKPIFRTKSKWLPSSHILSAELRPYSEALTVTNNNNKSEAKFFTQSANWTILTWGQVWNKKWQSRLRMGGQAYKLDEKNISLADDSKKNKSPYLSIGTSYQFNLKTKFTVDFVNRNEVYASPGSGSSVKLESMPISSMDLGANYRIKQWEKFDLYAAGTLHFVSSAEVPGASGGKETAKAGGMTLSSSLFYRWKKNLGVNSSLFYSSVKAEAQSIIFSRSALGMGFNFVWDV